MPESRFFQLNDNIGLEPQWIGESEDGEPIPHPNAGEPGPLLELSIAFSVPTMVGDELVDVPHQVVIRPESVLDANQPGAVIHDSAARIVRCDDPRAAAVMTEHDLYHEVEAPQGWKPPKGKQSARGDKTEDTSSTDGTETTTTSEEA